MLHNSYTRDYESLLDGWAPDDCCVVVAMIQRVALYTLANKYAIVPLKGMAKNKFAENMRTYRFTGCLTFGDSLRHSTTPLFV